MRVRTPHDIGLTIRDRRIELGLDQTELARRIGVSRQWLVEIEKGKPRAEIGLLLRALRALDLEVWLGAISTHDGQPESHPEGAIDLNRVIERARGEHHDD
jgi:HTH-type transcriptional regulator/antitoxin HipB